jgi:hypothetical protein
MSLRGIDIRVVPPIAALMPVACAASTQKPATQGCGRVLGVTNHFDENTTTHWTSQARFDLVLHSRCKTRQPRRLGLTHAVNARE